RLLLPRIHHDDADDDPAGLEPEPGQRRPRDRQVHNPARRPTHERRGLQKERHRNAGPRCAARGPGDALASAPTRGVSQPDAHSTLEFQIQWRPAISAAPSARALLPAGPRAQQPPTPPQPPTPQQPTEIETTISGPAGAPPRLAVPDFIPLSTDGETVAMARTIGQVLWDDLNFEREFLFIPRDVYATIPKATSFADVPFDRWRELNADGLVVGTVQKTSNGFRVEMKLFNVGTRQSAYSRQYDGSANARLYAHTISDELHKSQRALNGVARSKLTFDSDRDGERMSGKVRHRNIKEIYISAS